MEQLIRTCVKVWYVLQRTKSWLSPYNIALSVYSEKLAMTKEVLTSLTSLPEEVAIEDLLFTRRAKLRDFLPFPVKPRHASRLAQPNFGKLSKIIIAAMKEKYKLAERFVASQKDSIILHEETRQMFVYVHTYAVAPVDVIFAFVTVLVLLFLFL